MRHLRSVSSIFRKLVLLGWAVAVLWIYLGNLVNFHQHRIWGKQLIPVACYSTRAKEKEGLFTVKSDTDSRLLLPGQHFDFSAPGLQISYLPYIEYITSYSFLPDTPVLHKEFEAFSLRGPPTA